MRIKYLWYRSFIFDIVFEIDIVFVIVSFVIVLASTSVTNPATVELCEADIVNVDIYWGLFDILLGSLQKFRMI